MRQIKYVATNEVVVVEDQVALDAIISGDAVPNIDLLEESKAIEKAPKVASFDQAPETK